MLVLYNKLTPLSTVFFVVFLQQDWQGARESNPITHGQSVISAPIDLPPTYRNILPLCILTPSQGERKYVFIWCLWKESNFHPRVRSAVSCPLNDRGIIWMRGKYSKLLGRAYETDRSPESPQYSNK